MKKIKIILKKQNDKNEIYEEIVEFNESTNFLDLSNQNLIEIPKGLEQFKNLENLYLHDNQITKIENIHHLEKLKYLSVFEENQNENIKETKQISLNNYNLELKEIQIQKELLKQEKQRKEKEYFDNNFDKIKQQFIKSNKSNDNDLII